MGCDYYVYTCLCVTTKDNKQHQIQKSRENSKMAPTTKPTNKFSKGA